MTAILQLGGTWSIALIYFVTALGVGGGGGDSTRANDQFFGFVVQSHLKAHEKAKFLCEH